MMELRWVGAALVVGSCSGVGFARAAAQRRETRVLKQLLQVLEIMSLELSYRVTPLPELCRIAEERAGREVREYFRILSEILRSQVAPDASQCARIALSKCPQLPAAASQVLTQLSLSLGQYDFDGQLQGLKKACGLCECELNRCLADGDCKVRTYRTVGICAGMALAVLLF